LILKRFGLPELPEFVLSFLKLTFVAKRPPPPHIAYQEVLMAAKTSAEYFS